jgi:hypothetical protein
MNYTYATQYWLQINQNQFFITKGVELEPNLQSEESKTITMPITKWINSTEKVLLKELTTLPEIIYIKKMRVDLEQAIHYWTIINPKLLSKQVDEQLGINITIQFDQIIPTQTLEQALREFTLQKLIE